MAVFRSAVEWGFALVVGCVDGGCAFFEDEAGEGLAAVSGGPKEEFVFASFDGSVEEGTEDGVDTVVR